VGDGDERAVALAAAMEAPWVESCTTSPSPSQLATVACGSIALLWKAGVL